MLPLVLHLETATKKSQLHLLRLTFNSQQINDQNLLFLYKESECLILKLKDEIDYKVSVCMLETLIPEKGKAGIYDRRLALEETVGN